jgi:hypothetical protein
VNKRVFSVRHVMDALHRGSSSDASKKLVSFLNENGVFTEVKYSVGMDVSKNGVWTDVPAKKILSLGFFEHNSSRIGSITKNNVLSALIKIGAIEIK